MLLFRGVLASLLLAAAPAFGDWVLTQANGGKTATVYLSDAGYKQSTPDMETTWRFSDNALLIINHQMKEYSQIDADQFLQQLETMFKQLQARSPKTAHSPYRNVGSDNVAGLPCTRYQKVVARHTTTMWVSLAITLPPQLLGKVKTLMTAMTAMSHTADPDASFDGLPLRVVEREAGGERVLLDTIKAERLPVSASEFQAPTGYKRTGAVGLETRK